MRVHSLHQLNLFCLLAVLLKGKSASQKPTKGSQKVLKEKVKTLKKASSTGDMKKKISKALPTDESEKENQPKKKTKK